MNLPNDAPAPPSDAPAPPCATVPAWPCGQKLTLAGIHEPDDTSWTSIIEPPRTIEHTPARFVLDLSGRGVPRPPIWGLPRDVHGTNLLVTGNCLLFAANMVVERSGAWHCESAWHRSHLVAFQGSPGFDAVHPGRKPAVLLQDDTATVDCSGLADADLRRLDAPAFLATAAEPDNWMRWVVQVIPKLAWFRRNGAGRHLLCRAAKPWQQALLQSLGLRNDQVLEQDPGATYLCRDLAMHVQTSADGTVSAFEYELFQHIAAACNQDGHRGLGERIFVSRLGDHTNRPEYRVLRNEPELIAALSTLGFVAVEPEKLSFADQVRVFSNASIVVGLGGAGMANVAFCRPGTKLVSIQATDQFIVGFSGMFASLDMPYGIVYGAFDEPVGDGGNPHLCWRVSPEPVVRAVRDFL